MTRLAFMGEYVDRPHHTDAKALLACALIASNVPVVPPRDWFDNPHLRGPSALAVDDDGRVYGHIAAWHTNHIGLPFGTRPPHSRNGYAYFNKRPLRTDDGKDVFIGQLTLVGGHAPLDVSYKDAVKHYDDTDSAVADVHIGEDAYGIWAAGALRPNVTPERVRAFRAASLSGDWRPIDGRLELVAVCAVNVPGFPIARTNIAASGYVTALVAAGAAAIAELRGPSIDERLDRIERALTARTAPDADLSAQAAALVARVESHRTAQPNPDSKDLTSLAAAAVSRVRALTDADDEMTVFKDVSTKTREEYARKGWSLPDGSYPIASMADVRRAVRAYGRARPEDKTKVRRHIMRRARGLGRADLIPSSWKSASVEERYVDIVATFRDLADRRQAAVEQEITLLASGIDDPLLRMRAQSLVAALTYAQRRARGDFENRLHPRDDSGKFRDVLARIKTGLIGQSGEGVDQVNDEVDAAARANMQGNDAETERHLKAILDTVDKVGADIKEPNIAKTLRQGFEQLGRFVGKLGVATQAGSDTFDPEKLRYTDLDGAVHNLIDDLLQRLKSRVSAAAYQKAVGELPGFMAGGDVWTATELMTALSRILRFLMGADDAPGPEPEPTGS
jgi:hypothetical protein